MGKIYRRRFLEGGTVRLGRGAGILKNGAGTIALLVGCGLLCFSQPVFANDSIVGDMLAAQGESLRGIKAVRVEVEVTYPRASLITLHEETVREWIESDLREKGVRLLDSVEYKLKPDGLLLVSIEVVQSRDEGDGVFSIRISLLQHATLKNTQKELVVRTWEADTLGRVSKGDILSLKDGVSELISDFARDFFRSRVALLHDD